MALYVGIGLSSRSSSDPFAAGQEAAAAARLELEGEEPRFAIVLASAMFDQPELVRGVITALQGVPFVGCTTAGLIADSAIREHAVGVLVMGSSDVVFTPIKVERISADMRNAGRRFGEIAVGDSRGKPKAAFIFSDALSGNGTELVRGVFEILGSDFALVGGAAGDDMQFKKTYQYTEDGVLTDAAVGVALSGAITAEVGADHGWSRIGKPYVATKAKGTTLYELDGKPAFTVYEEYLGKRSIDIKKALSLLAVTYPLGMKTTESEKVMIRVPLAVGEDGSIVCGAELIEGSEIYLMVGTIEGAFDAARATAKALMEKKGAKTARLAFLSNCVARKILYGDRGMQEIDMLRSIFGPGARIFGFYSYGQIAPFEEKAININSCDPGFYEQSISIAVFG